MLQQLIANLEAAKQALQDFNDGYRYIVEVSSFGNSWTYTFTNSYTAVEYADSYNGDNGIAVVYTDNPELLKSPGYSVTLHIDEFVTGS